MNKSMYSTDIIQYDPSIKSAAEFFKWYENTIGVIKRFCNLCYVDSALVEAYLGVSLDWRQKYVYSIFATTWRSDHTFGYNSHKWLFYLCHRL